MNWCQPHWDQLRQAIKVRGLDNFGAKNSEELKAQIENDNEEKFDPLMGSWMRINQHMIESPGCRGRILECPMCILVTDGQPDLVAKWIDGCTDEALKYAIEKGYLKYQ